MRWGNAFLSYHSDTEFTWGLKVFASAALQRRISANRCAVSSFNWRAVSQPSSWSLSSVSNISKRKCCIMLGTISCGGFIRIWCWRECWWRGTVDQRNGGKSIAAAEPRNKRFGCDVIAINKWKERNNFMICSESRFMFLLEQICLKNACFLSRARVYWC